MDNLTVWLSVNALVNVVIYRHIKATVYRLISSRDRKKKRIFQDDDLRIVPLSHFGEEQIFSTGLQNVTDAGVSGGINTHFVDVNRSFYVLGVL